MHGQGTIKGNNGNEYKGEWRFDKKHGKGEFKYSKGDRYQGDYVNNNMEVYGTYYFNSPQNIY